MDVKKGGFTAILNSKSERKKNKLNGVNGVGLLSGTGRFCLISFEHEGHEVIPVIKRQIVQERA